MSTLARRLGRIGIIDRAQQARLALDVGHRLALVPGMIAECQAIGTGLKKVHGDGFRQTEAAGGVLGVHHDEIER